MGLIIVVENNKVIDVIASDDEPMQGWHFHRALKRFSPNEGDVLAISKFDGTLTTNVAGGNGPRPNPPPPPPPSDEL